MSGPGAAQASTAAQVPVAVVGVGALVPGATDAAGYWRIVTGGRDLITEVPASRWLVADHYDPDPAAPDKTYARRGAFLPEVDFEPLAYGVPPANLSATDTSQLLALLVADQVLTDAGGLSGVDRDRVGVVLGAAALELLPHMYGRAQRPVWAKALRESGLPEAEVRAVCDRIAAHFNPWQESTFPGLLGNVVAGRIANRFDLHGINHTTDAACASSLAALSTAVGELSLGRADLVISGGVDTGNDIGMFLCFSKTPALSPTGDCRPFSDAADGTMLGEAVVMYALKRLSDAERNGDRIHAVIRGVGASSDGRSTAIYAPLPGGQARALRRAYEQAGYGPRTVELVEAHGTGTKAGDAAELAALHEVFEASEGTDAHDGQWCAIGSVKSQIGHTKCAAGAAGLLKAVMALHHKVLPPTIKVGRPIPAAAAPDGPFYVNTETRPWVRPAGHPRRASVSSFGFGGSNFHVTLEEYVPSGTPARVPPRHRSAPSELVLFSGASPADLVSPDASGDRPLAALARESQRAFSATDPLRLAVVATDIEDLREKYAQALSLIRQRPGTAFATPNGVRYACGDPAVGRLAFLFPGQGSQYVGMGADLSMLAPAAQAVWDRLGGARFDGRPLHRVVFPPPAFADEERAAQVARLAATEWAQPALAVHALALLEVLRELGLRPDCVAGHSFGELVALHCAGALDADTLVSLARRRGELMREAAVVPGAMLAVATDRAHMAAALAEGAFGDIWSANLNSPRQVVLSGTAEAVARAERAFAAEGVGTHRLTTSTAFHSPLVAPAAEPLATFLHTVPVAEPRIEVYGNADATPYPTSPDAVRRRIADQLASPVLFQDQIEAMYAAGVRTFVEVGAGAALTGLVGQILGDRAHAAVSLDRAERSGVSTLHTALGELAVRGVPFGFYPLWAPYGSPEPPAKERAPRMTVKISGANYGQLYPPCDEAAEVAEPAEVAETPELRPSAPVSGHRPEHPHPQPAPASDIPAVPMSSNTPAPEPSAYDAVSAYEAMSPYEAVSPYDTEAASPYGTESGAAPGAEWYAAVESVQRQTAEAHAACQRMLTDSHLAFLRMTETTLAAMLGVQAVGDAPDAPTSLTPLPLPRPSEPRQAPAPVTSAPAVAVEQRTSVAAPVVPPAPATDAAPVPPPELSAPELSAPELEELLLSVVAQLTGYPVEMLTVDMELEADLGVDSIKRVEILSAVRRRVGDLATGDVGELGKLRTLREIVEALTTTGRPPGTPGPNSRTPDGRTPDSRTSDSRPPSSPAQDSPAEARSHTVAKIPAMRTESEPDKALTRLVQRAVESPASGLATAGLLDGPLVVTDGGVGRSAITDLVALKLAERGVDATAVTKVPEDARAVVHLGGLTGGSGQDDAREAHRSVFRAARTMAAQVTEWGGLFVTVQDTGGDFGLRGHAPDRAWLGGVAGLTRTAAKEWPGASVKAIDCECGDRCDEEVAEAIVRELFEGGPDPEVGLRADGTRTTPRVVPAPVVPGGTRRITSESVIVATGGARGVTAAALLDLARAHRPRIVLLGRTAPAPEPEGLASATDEPALTRLLAERSAADATNAAHAADSSPARIAARAREILAAREVRATLAALEEAGSPVRYVPVDVRDGDAVAAALREVREVWGPVTGIVHGAGVLADKWLADKTEEQVERVMSTKVDGLRALLAATADDPLEVICLFSSVAAVFGNAGQSDYAMANEVLGQVASAEQARRPDCLVRCVAWGPWRGGMVTPALAGHFGRSGVPLIPLEQGAAAFTAELDGAAGEARVVLVAGDDPAALSPAGDPRPAQVLVRADSAPQLADHAITGVPVLPVAMVLNWFAGAATAWLPGANSLVLRDLRVYQKYELPELDGPGHRLTVHGSRGAAGSPSGLEAELRGESGVAHFRAVLDAGAEEPDPAAWSSPEGLKPLGRGELYDGECLFHGPRFHCVRSLQGVSAHGAEAIVAGVRALEWPGEHWPLDPAAVDGALQLALVWAQEELGAATLPMAVAECRVHRGGPVEDTVRCVVRGRKVHSTGARCDAALIDADGAVRLELLGVELVRRPS
ncbi:SDR family oxidoreductase [Streptomyces sp. RY43-2]|uniref:SDR family oxidoreductase n=1 Tax=Streptomyces macrolidinus TaxID=2952607 RepID=A0ABT0ZFG7_9ACTN|nr:type I polyketide synthase [Streptomyces macrolidinus]MCN9242318.1 SDR family oxidoreductase [Streptomyces macrolidinus]